MIFLKRFFLLFLLISITIIADAQIEIGFLPLEIDQNNQISDFFISNPNKKFHSSFQPFDKQTVFKNDTLKSNNFIISDKNKFEICFLKDKKAQIKVNTIPLFQSEVGFDALKNNSTFFQSGGLKITTSIGSKILIQSQFKAGLIRESNFIDTIIESSRIVPGLGIAYLQKTDKTYSFQNFSGSITYAPKSFINFQLAKDKIFIGDGYRSLLLSDVANNYPYFKTSLSFLNFQYNVWYSWFYNIQDAYGIKSDFKNKYGTFHYLSWNATKNISISFFENVIFQGTDTTRSRGFDVNYLNPVIFFRPVEYSLGSSDNSMMGLNLSINFLKKFKWYTQIVLDEFFLKEIRARKGWWANKQGIQTGIKHINTFGINHLSTHVEFNWVRPYTYTHGSPDQSYTHFNQALTHPFGANFTELIVCANYHKNKWLLSSKLILSTLGKDSISASSNIGQNIFLSYTTRNNEYGNYTGQGVKTTFLHAEIKLNYCLVPDLNLRIETGIIQRVFKNENGFDRRTPFFFLGIKTDLYNFYRDLL
jgi:hypothetical protein